jgi:hypothetical protein
MARREARKGDADLPMSKNIAKTGPGNPPEPDRKNSPLLSWTFIVALLGAGALPCPECGTPLIWHLWPLAGLLLVARGLARRAGRTRRPDPSCPPPQADPGIPDGGDRDGEQE